MAAEEREKVLRHVVLFAFKPTATPEDIRRIEEAFAALPGKIDAVQDFEWGTDVSIEGKADGYTHCFFVTFRDEAGRAVYLPHPDHKAFGALLRPHVDKVLVLDYFTSRPCGTQRREGEQETSRPCGTQRREGEQETER